MYILNMYITYFVSELNLFPHRFNLATKLNYFNALILSITLLFDSSNFPPLTKD